MLFNQRGVYPVIAGFDLGTKSGFAVQQRDGSIVSGTHKFKPKNTNQKAHEYRFHAFREFLGELHAKHNIQLISYEYVTMAHKSYMASHLYGGFRAILLMFALSHNIRVEPVHISAIKKHVTGKGNAKKEEMLHSVQHNGYMLMLSVTTFDEADAIGVAHWAATHYDKVMGAFK